MKLSSGARIAARERESKPDSKGGELVSVTFEPAKGGLISRTRRKRGGKSDSWDTEEEMAVHPSLSHAKTHLQTSFNDLLND